MIQGKNHEPFYITAKESIELVKKFKKPFMPQESLDPPDVIHIPNVKHKNGLSFANVYMRNHLRKYVWRWIMAKSQLIDIYQKDLTKKLKVPERYDPNGYNPFEKDALIIRQFWNQLTDYANLDFQGTVEKGPGEVQMVLSSSKESVVYLSSKPGIENEKFNAEDIHVTNLNVDDGQYTAEIWKLAAPGGIIQKESVQVTQGQYKITLPEFVDDLLVVIHK